MNDSIQTCGFCGGSGTRPGRTHDAYGPRYDYPLTVTCEYCGGSGAVEGGANLLPATPHSEEYLSDRASATPGLPPWA